MEDKIVNQLQSVLKASVKKNLEKEKKVAVIYSGGIDSSLIAYLAHQSGAGITTFTVGLPDSADIIFVLSIKKKLPFKPVVKIITRKELLKALPQTRKIIQQTDLKPNLMQISLATCLFLVFEEIKKAGFDLVLSGQGADEIFAGYHKFEQFPFSRINQLCQKELERALAIDRIRDQAIAGFFKIKLKNPFLESEVTELALKIPPQLKLKKKGKKTIHKYILRKLGQRVGILKETLTRPKKAFQYSTLIQREIEKITRRQQFCPRPDKLTLGKRPPIGRE
ncbi:MAG: asparagine synthetase B [Candidatus Pacebacteria bacterium]|nr:asparagine synthetase B [Candidatus Paceibacterota bacterium]